MVKPTTDKTLADLTEDTPEDIVAELEARSRTLDEVVQTPTPEEPDTPEVEPEVTETKETTTEEPAAEEPTEEVQEDPLTRELNELGIGPYKSREDAIKGIREMRTRLSQRDEDALLGRYLQETGLSPEELEELVRAKNETGKKPATTSGWAPPHEWDPDWDSQIEQVVGEDGATTLKGPPEIVRKVEENERYQRQQMQRFLRNPVQTLVDWGLQDRLQGAVRAEQQRLTGQQQYETFMGEHGDFVREHNDELIKLLDQGYNPVAAVQHLQLQKENEELRKTHDTEDAKRKALRKAAERTARRSGAQAAPLRKQLRDLSKMSTREALEAMDMETDIPESW